MSDPSDNTDVMTQMQESVYWMGFLGNSHTRDSKFTVQVLAGSLLADAFEYTLLSHDDCEFMDKMANTIQFKCPSLERKILDFTESFSNLKCPKFDQGNEGMVRHFIRGLVDHHGAFVLEPRPQLNLLMCSVFSEELLALLEDKLGPYEQTCMGLLTWNGVTAFDACAYLYDGLPPDYPLVNEQIRRTFQPVFRPRTCYVKNHDDAILSKKRASDSGYDLNLVSLVKQDGNLYYYDTGIAIQPEFGFYFDLVPRSSLPKTGYMLANNVGVIDNSYTGTIKVALVKFDLTKPDLELPCRAVQLIARSLVLPFVYEVDDLNATQRGTDGGIVRSLQ